MTPIISPLEPVQKKKSVKPLVLITMADYLFNKEVELIVSQNQTAADSD
jgi:hypothetical protein